MSGLWAAVPLSLVLAGFAACQKSSLQPDTPTGGIRPPSADGGPGTGAGAGPGTGAAGTSGAFDGGFAGGGGPVGTGGAFDGGGPPVPDYGASTCVNTSVLLPWATVTGGSPTRLELVTSTDAIAVLNRQPSLLDIRTYRRDGTPLGGLQLAPDVQLLPNGADHFVLIARGTTGDFVATDLPPTLTGGRRVLTAGSTATEQLRAAVPLSATLILLTTERFINMGGAFVPWTTSLGPEAQTFASGRVYGVAAQADEILVAGGSGQSLSLMVLDSAGNVVRSVVDPQGIVSPAPEATTAMAFGSGLLMFDGNPLRLTQIGFDLSRVELGHHTQLETFYRTAPRVAPIVLMGQPVGFWLTVFPGTDNTQGNTLHRVFGCAFDASNPAICAPSFPIAETGLDGYEIAQDPIAAAALPGAANFAVAHADASNRTWLRIANVDCGVP